MSSHHVVREHQEPALLVWDSSGIDFSLVQQLLEWSPVVAVHVKALPFFLVTNTKVDVVFCETDQLPKVREQIALQEPVKIVATNNVAVTDAILFLHKEGAFAVNVFDKPKKEIYNIVDTNIKLVFYHGGSSYVSVQNEFSKWLPQHTLISILPIETAQISTKGFEGDVSGKLINEEVRLLAAKDGQVSLKIHQGSVWWVEETG